MTIVLPMPQPFSLPLAPLLAAASAPGHGSSAEAAPDAAAGVHGAGAGVLESASHAAGLDGLTLAAVIGFFLAILLGTYCAPQIVEFTAHLDRSEHRKSFRPSIASCGTT